MINPCKYINKFQFIFLETEVNLSPIQKKPSLLWFEGNMSRNADDAPSTIYCPGNTVYFLITASSKKICI